ncbi:aminoglycoside phosphotransferase family protein [Chloroflexi bacterium TSY]|nr:aminoglycoside phosphotransferase family protein [Chloroflexi bacterium TSY]
MSRLPSTETIKQIADLVTNTSNCCVKFIGQGATSAAWRVDAKTEALIIRMILRGTNRPVTYRSEFTILQLLHSQGAYVPEPLLNSLDDRSQPIVDITEPWAITRVLPGQALQKEAMSHSVANSLGTFLAHLHGIPVQGYGRLQEDESRICGQQTDALSGILARWCWGQLWPFDQSSLHDHPFAKMDPALIPKLQMVQAELLELASSENAVLLHADLHGEHIFQENSELTGVIDFGAAAIGLPAWDFAILAHYHGWAAVQQVLMEYDGSVLRQKAFVHQVQELAIVIGLYKLERAVKADASKQKVERIRKFVCQTIGGGIPNCV